jgi:oxygen-dependent protoporphyrinogen oxidase
MGDQVIGSNDHLRATWIWKGGRLVRMPEGMKLMVPVELGPILRSPLIGLGGKLRIWREQFRRPLKREDDVSVSQFIGEHYGRDVVEYLAEPLLAGVFGGDPNQMSAEAVLTKFVEYEAKYGSLTKGARKAPEPSQGSLFLTLRDGLGSLVQALLDRVGPSIVRGTVEKIEKDWRVRVDGEWMEATDVVICCKAQNVLPDLFPPVEYSSSTVVALIYDRKDVPHPLNGFGFLVPKIERRSVAACTWMGTKFPHRVPKDKALLRCFVSGNVKDVRQELAQKMGITAEPLHERVIPWPQSMPQYTVGHKKRVEIVEEMLRDFPGLHVAGNAYYGVGIPDCVRMAKQVAGRITA